MKTRSRIALASYDKALSVEAGGINQRCNPIG